MIHIKSSSKSIKKQHKEKNEESNNMDLKNIDYNATFAMFRKKTKYTQQNQQSEYRALHQITCEDLLPFLFSVDGYCILRNSSTTAAALSRRSSL